MGTLTGVAWNALSTLVSFCFTWSLTGSLKGTRNLDIVLYFFFKLTIGECKES